MVNRILKNRKVAKKTYTYRRFSSNGSAEASSIIDEILAFSLTEADSIFHSKHGFLPHTVSDIYVVLPPMD